MKWPRFATRLGLCKILKGIMALACLKICLLAFLGWQAVLTGPVHTDMAPKATQTLAQLAVDGPSVAHAQAEKTPAQEPAATAAPAAQKKKVENTTPLGREALMDKQEELNRRERELKKLERKISRDMAELQKSRQQLQQMLKDAKAVKSKKERHLVEVFSNMKAKQAAQVLQTMNEEQAVNILSGMRGRQAGEILTFVEAQKAARLAEKLTRLQVPFE